MKRLFHKAMTILLSGAVLASSVLPPAVCHAHAGGNRHHSHERDHAEPASNDHKHDHGHHHHMADDSDHQGQDHERPANELPQCDAEIELAVAHLHLSIAGFDFSLPLPSDDGSNGPLGPTRDDAGYFGIVRLTDDTITVPRVDLSTVIDVSIAAPVVVDSLVDAAVQAARWLCARTADRTLLCDSARCERSGVLRN
ncbi:MAG: hypothetical protein O3B13_22870 [Planctomycetota bacterium]|nr:hypothetical protein [Planctomycetota bacterium]